MSDYWIYRKYTTEMRWIKDHHRKIITHFSKDIFELAQYYSEQRLNIINRKIVLKESRTGRVFPYIGFWFCDAFGITDRHIVRQLALGLTYAAIFVSIRDDLLDDPAVLKSRVPSVHTHIALANWYYNKYYQIFKNIFPSSSRFWYTFAYCMNEWPKYETWSLLYKNDPQLDSLSRSFLEKSSSYLFAITLPTLAAICILAKRKPSTVADFLRFYCMAFRIADDLRDWKDDLHAAGRTDSCVILYVMKKLRTVRVSDTDVESIFLDREFIKSAYGKALYYLYMTRVKAKRFRSPVLDKWIEIQIEYLSEYREFYLKRIETFKESLAAVFIGKT